MDTADGTPPDRPQPPEDVPAVSDLTPQRAVPDVFEIAGSDRIRSADAWREQRRSELMALLRTCVYGYVPPAPTPTFEVTHEDDPVLGGAATLKRITIRFPDLPEDAPTPRLALFVPTGIERPRPVVFGLNAFGNHTVADVPSLHRPTQSRESDELPDRFGQRGGRADYWRIRDTIERGYAFTTAHSGAFSPDDPDRSPTGHLGSQTDCPSAVRGGIIAAWAWGTSRCIDYLIEDPDVRNDGIVAFGHSRHGKAILLAGASDERIALVVPHQSGTGGVALNRHEPTASTGETVEEITNSFPEWFDDRYGEFAADVTRLPIDQHHLVGLVAPRAILSTESTPEVESRTNPDAALRSIQLASDVWELLEDRSIHRDELSQVGGTIPEDSPPVFQYRRATGHTMTPEFWQAIYDFADQHVGSSSVSR